MSSDVLIQLGTKGADTIIKVTKEALDKAVKEKGPKQKIGFPETNYYFPLADALLKTEVKTLEDCASVVTQAQGLNNNQATANGFKMEALGGVLNKGVATLLCEEILAALKYLNKEHPHKECAGFLSDTLLRALGIQLVDGRIAGIAVILGPAKDEDSAVQLVRDFQSRSIVSLLVGNLNGNTFKKQLENKNVELGLDNYIVPMGEDYLSAIYAVNFAVRAPLTFGGLKSGQWQEILKYTQGKVPAFVVLLSHVDEVIVATGLGVLAMGFPIITDLEVPQLPKIDTTLYEALVTEKDYKKLSAKCVEVRGLKVKVANVAVPVPYAAAFEGERVRKEQLYVEFGGKASNAFEFLYTKKMDEVEDGKIEIIGSDIDRMEKGSKSMPLAIIVEVSGRKMQKDFEPILERQIHRFINYAMGLMHVGQRDMNWIRISKDAFDKGFRLKHIGVILHAMLHQEYSAIVDKVQVKLYTLENDINKLLAQAKKVFDQRDERLSGMTDESVDTFYSCLLCVPQNEEVIFTDGSFKRMEDVINDSVEAKNHKALSFDTYDFLAQPIGELFINPAPALLTKISLRSGNSLILTPNHKVLIDAKDGLSWQAAASLKKNDTVVSVRNTNIENKGQKKNFYLIDFLPLTLRVYDNNFIEYLKGEIISKYKKLGLLAKELSIDYGRFYGVFYNKAKYRGRLTLGETKAIISKLDLDWDKEKLKICVFGTTRSKGCELLKTELDEDIMYLAGLVSSDGCVLKRKNGLHVQFTNSEKALIEKFDVIINSLFGVRTKTYYTPPRIRRSKKLTIISKKKVAVLHVNNSIFGWMLKEMGIGREDKEKWRGEKVSKLPNNLVACFLRGLFDGDGHVTGTHIFISTGSYREAQHTLLLLKKIGIGSYIARITRGFQVGTRNFGDYKKFREVISSSYPAKKAKMDEAKFSISVNHVVRSDAVPLKCAKLIQNIFLKYKNRIEFTKLPVDYKSIEYWRKGKRRASKDKLKLFLDSIKDKIVPQDADYRELLLWAKSNMVFEKVKSIKKLKYSQKKVYNFSVANTHNYLINGIVVKNCQSFAPNHVCIVTPERLGLCGAYSWLDAKAAHEITPTGPNQPIPTGAVLDKRLGQWQNVNDFVYNKSNKSIEKVSMYSLMDSPQSSCVIDDTGVIIDNELVTVGEFIDKNRGGQDYAKSKALTLKEGKASPEKIVAMQRFELLWKKKNLVKIKTKSGMEITLTGDHQIAADRPEGLKWIPASKIRKGDRVISLKNLEVEEKLPDIYDLMPKDFYDRNKKAKKELEEGRFINKDLFYLMGLIASDGSVFKRGNYEYNIYFINTKKELIKRYEKLYRAIFPQKNLHIGRKAPAKNSVIKGRKINSRRDCYVCYSNNYIFGILLESFGIAPQKSKRCFRNLLSLPREYIANFLAGLFDGDGSVRLRKYAGKWDIAEGYLCCRTKKQAHYLHLLLKRFGILSNLRKSSSIYKVELHGNNIYEFSNIIEPVHKEKKELIRKIRLLHKEKELDKTQTKILPFSMAKSLVELPEAKAILSPSTYFYYKTFRSRPTFDNIRKVIEKSDSKKAKVIRSLLDGNFYLDIVKEAKVNHVNKKYVYNLTLSDIHCYFANQMLIKNCGCFECILAIIPEANGVMVVHRDFSGITPCGMNFTTLAGSVGGGVQTPGFLGVGKLYITSKKFISAEGGLKRLVWMPKELKEALADKLKKRAQEIGEPVFFDKIADESVATTSEELLNYLQKVNHPALSMDSLM